MATREAAPRDRTSSYKVIQVESRRTVLNIVMLLLLGLAIISALVHFWLLPRWRVPSFATEYQAVFLSNGAAYYGKLDRLWTPYPVLTDVYYVQRAVDEDSGKTSIVLVKRGNELHGPDRMVLNARNILLIEPVAPDSQVATRIAERAAQR